jgi:DNA repair protein RadC
MQNNAPSLFSVSEVELVYRNKVKPTDRHKISNSANAYDIFLSVWDMNKIEMVEQFYVLLLDRSQHCLGVSNVFTGGISSCLIDPKIVFATALKANASGIILAHNHPSGNLSPSKADIALTQRLKAGGNLLDILVADHLIVTPFNYYSFTDEYVPF